MRNFLAFTLIVALFAFGACAAIAKVAIQVDLDSQKMTVTRGGAAPIVWRISSGRPGFDTPTGSFIVQRLDANHFSDEYDQAPMPYAIFFSRGLAIHGTYQGGIGRPASHGCVRLSVDHARQLFDWVEKEGASIDIAGSGSGFSPGSGGFATRSDVDFRPLRKRRNLNPIVPPVESPVQNGFFPF